VKEEIIAEVSDTRMLPLEMKLVQKMILNNNAQ
jgi:hypothetical protein